MSAHLREKRQKSESRRPTPPANGNNGRLIIPDRVAMNKTVAQKPRYTLYSLVTVHMPAKFYIAFGVHIIHADCIYTRAANLGQ